MNMDKKRSTAETQRTRREEEDEWENRRMGEPAIVISHSPVRPLSRSPVHLPPPRSLRLRGGNSLRHRGGAILETALVLPVLLSITFGAIEFGYFFWIQHTLEGAALDGCRAAIVSGATNSDVTTQAKVQLTAAGLDPSVYTITTIPASVASAAAGTNITVTVASTWSQAGFQVLGLISPDKSIAGTCVMRHE